MFSTFPTVQEFFVFLFSRSKKRCCIIAVNNNWEKKNKFVVYLLITDWNYGCLLIGLQLLHLPAACGRIYGGNLLHGHPLNTDTRVERTVSIVPKKCSYLFSEINPLNTGYLRTIYGWISYLRKPKRKTESCHITFSPSGWVAMNALWQSKLRSRIPLSCFKERILVWDWQMIASFLQNKLVTVTEKKWSDVFP